MRFSQSPMTLKKPVKALCAIGIDTKPGFPVEVAPGLSSQSYFGGVGSSHDRSRQDAAPTGKTTDLITREGGGS
jgi:hypothetical protein